MTVEAAMIVCTVSVIAIGFLLLFLYFFDVGQAQGCLSETLVRISSKEEVVLAMEKQKIEQYLSGQLMVTEIEQVVIYEGLTAFSGEVKLSLKIVLPVMEDWLGNWKNTLYVQVEKGNMADRIRRWTVIE